MERSAQERKVLNQHVTLATQDPKQALEKGWYEDPAFCRGFFERSEDLALVAAPGAFDLAQRGVEIADHNGDRCLVHRSLGVLAHAHLARSDAYWSGKTLEGYRVAALDCCSRCRYDFLYREGDLLGERRKPEEALVALKGAEDEAGNELGADAYARLCFPRSVVYHFRGQRERALADAGEVLAQMALESPRGFFLDSIALVAVYLGGGGTAHDALALELLKQLRARIRGLKGWKAVYTRLYWAEGHLYARLGDIRRATDALKQAQCRLIDGGLLREAVAVTLDRAQLKCRPSHLREDNLDTARTVIGFCLRKRADLDEDQRRGLEKMLRVLQRAPEKAFREIGAFRRSFIAPVPGLLGERIGPE